MLHDLHFIFQGEGERDRKVEGEGEREREIEIYCLEGLKLFCTKVPLIILSI